MRSTGQSHKTAPAPISDAIHKQWAHRSWALLSDLATNRRFSLLGSIICFNGFKTHRNTELTLLDCYKGYNSGTTKREETHRVRCVGRGAEFPFPPQKQHPSQISTCPPTLKLSRPYTLGLLWRLHYTGITQAWLINPWPLVTELTLQPLSLPRRSSGGTESCNPPIKAGSPVTSSIHKGFPKVTPLTQRYDWK